MPTKTATISSRKDVAETIRESSAPIDFSTSTIYDALAQAMEDYGPPARCYVVSVAEVPHITAAEEVEHVLVTGVYAGNDYPDGAEPDPESDFDAATHVYLKHPRLDGDGGLIHESNTGVPPEEASITNAVQIPVHAVVSAFKPDQRTVRYLDAEGIEVRVIAPDEQYYVSESQSGTISRPLLGRVFTDERYAGTTHTAYISEGDVWFVKDSVPDGINLQHRDPLASTVLHAPTPIEEDDAVYRAIEVTALTEDGIYLGENEYGFNEFIDAVVDNEVIPPLTVNQSVPEPPHHFALPDDELTYGYAALDADRVSEQRGTPDDVLGVIAGGGTATRGLDAIDGEEMLTAPHIVSSPDDVRSALAETEFSDDLPLDTLTVLSQNLYRAVYTVYRQFGQQGRVVLLDLGRGNVTGVAACTVPGTQSLTGFADIVSPEHEEQPADFTRPIDSMMLDTCALHPYRAVEGAGGNPVFAPKVPVDRDVQAFGDDMTSVRTNLSIWGDAVDGDRTGEMLAIAYNQIVGRWVPPSGISSNLILHDTPLERHIHVYLTTDSRVRLAVNQADSEVAHTMADKNTRRSNHRTFEHQWRYAPYQVTEIQPDGTGGATVTLTADHGSDERHLPLGELGQELIQGRFVPPHRNHQRPADEPSPATLANFDELG